jgi:hypothetical protein
VLLDLRDHKEFKEPQEDLKELKVLREVLVQPVLKEPKVQQQEPQVLLDQQGHRMLD